MNAKKISKFEREHSSNGNPLLHNVFGSPEKKADTKLKKAHTKVKKANTNVKKANTKVKKATR